MTNLLPKTIYHYTNESGLYGILDSQCLWATHYKFLNDSAEIKHIFEFLDELLKKYPKGTDKNTAAGRMGRTLVEMFGHDGRKPWVDVFILSFCKSPDLLSQWRAYGKQGGYAIGLDGKQLHDLAEGEALRYNLGILDPWRAVYKDEEKMQFLENTIQTFLKLGVDSKDPKTLKEIAVDIIKYAPYFKHSGFESEEEFRVVAYYSNRQERPWTDSEITKQKLIHFREENDMRIPFIKLFDDEDFNLPIKEIIIGPPQGSGAERKKRALELYLANKKIDAEVKITNIPFVERFK